MAFGTFARDLILTQKDPNVLLVPLLLEIAEKWENSLVAACARVEKQVLLNFRQLTPRLVHRNPLPPRELGQCAPLVVVAGFGPWIDRTAAERALGIWDDHRFVVLEDGTKSIAALTCAARVVEREKCGRWSGCASSVVRALEALGEAEALVAVGDDDHALAITVSEGGAYRVNQSRHDVGGDR